MTKKGVRGQDKGGLLATLLVLFALSFTPSLQVVAVAPARASSTFSVDIAEFQPTLFSPKGVTISAGDTVCWTSLVGDHTTTADPGQAEYWDSGDLNDGMTFCFTFTQSGNFTYHSSFPEDAGQTGWVGVQQAAPEFPGSMVYVCVLAAIFIGLFVERKMKSKGLRRSPTQSR